MLNNLCQIILFLITFKFYSMDFCESHEIQIRVTAYLDEQAYLNTMGLLFPTIVHRLTVLRLS